MIIDNFDIIRSKLTFESDFDRYIVHILKRAKDEDGKSYGVNETNRLLKTFYITSLEYFDKKIPVIKDLCESNNARAYILPQVRNNEDCLKELLKIVVDNLSNPTIKPDHLIRSAYAGNHKSRDKKWIIDLDDDNLTEYRFESNFGGFSINKKEWTPVGVLEFIKGKLKSIGKSEESAYMLNTPHGHCIVTSPFNVEESYKECSMIYGGVQKKVIGEERNENPRFMSDNYKTVSKDITGWLIKDGMALLYFNKQ